MFDKILTKDEIIKMLEKFKNIYFYFKRDGCVTSIRWINNRRRYNWLELLRTLINLFGFKKLGN